MQLLAIRTAWRALWKNKFYTIINLLGLSIATAAFLLLITYVRFERSYENFHSNADNIYRLTLDLYKGAEYVVTDCETYPPMGPEFKNKFPEVKDYVRLQDIGESEISIPEKAFLTTQSYAADASLFSIFNFTFIKGDSKTALSSPGQAVITAAIANKLFGSTDVLGKQIKIRDQQVVIAGVLKEIPANTHLKFDVLLPFNTIEKWGFVLNSWGGNNNYTYLQMQPGTDLATFNDKLKQFSKERLRNEIVTAEPIKTIHLYSHKTFEPDVNGNAKTVNFLLLIALLIVIVGSANYVNLTTARSVEKNKEASIRKVLGSSKASLIKLYFTEAFLLNGLSIILSLLLIEVALPFYSSIVGEAVAGTVFSSTGFWFITGLVFILNALLSGIYPAFMLSTVKAAMATTRNFTGTLKGNLIRRILVVGQFTVALIVLSGAVIIYQQLYFVRHQNLGMNIDQVLIVKGPQTTGTDSAKRYMAQAFKNELMQIPGIQRVSSTASLPGTGLNSLNTNTDVNRYGQTVVTGYNFYLYGVDEDFLPVMDIQLVAGTNFSTNEAENKRKIIINEEAARLLGFQPATAAVGQLVQLYQNNQPPSTVIGVIKNYHQQSLKESQLPMIHWYEKDITNYFAAKIHTSDVQQVISALEKNWQRDFSGHVFDYNFMDEMYNRQYKEDVQFGNIVNIFSVFTLFITCLGLLGLTAYNVSRRSKEISIRKILGASAQGIITLLSKDFLKLIVIAVVIAIPLCVLAMNKWLQSFTYRIEINWWVFVLTGFVMLLIAFLAISIQAIKAAIARPVDSLRSE